MALTAPPLALWVVPVAELGGVARHVLDTAAVGLPGYRLVVQCPPGPLAERLRELKAAVTTAPVGPEHGVRESVSAVRHAVHALAPAVVHSHLAWADVVVAAATVGASAAVVSTEHGIAGDDLVYHGTAWRSRLRAGLHTARLRRADAVIAVSEATARTLRAKWHPGRGTAVHVVPNGVDPLPDTPDRSPGLHVVSVARLAPEKRLDDLLRAVAVLHGRHPEARLTLAGSGPEEASLRAFVTDLGLGDVVDLPGHVDAPSLLERADVLVQLSVWENCSYSLLDALVHGAGAVATPVGGNPEILPPDALVAATDAGAVADAVERQALDPTTRPRLPDGWPTREEMTARVTEVYDSVTGTLR
ncbi:glycosyltransferase family 4 protein [Phycicoccus sonneratiae]|uniref:Glycosyltransferase family 4 protein n=1 Tax=Phycicoccus sonneratiae TaxID=2807628 RepID=A0ABS2CGY8_9MICO|nr:glycosyltransferase family 4 protein [Phycicoccus sonneraticus]MBM6399140.1 glycosyltransferase family 4 protein [Phycicoccus sonneraticus]